MKNFYSAALLWLITMTCYAQVTLEDIARTHAVSFAINDVMYVGLGEMDNNRLSDFYRINPVTEEVTPIADFPGAARTEAVAFVIDGVAYVGTGRDENANLLGDFYAYRPSEDTWSAVASIVLERYSAVSFAVDDKGYVGTGMGATDELNDFWRYDPAANSWTEVTGFTRSKRQGATALVIEEKAYVSGGFYFDDFSNSLSDVQAFDPASGSWTEEIVAAIDLSFGGATAFTLGAKGYIVYGNHGYVVTYDPLTNTIENLGDILGIDIGELGDTRSGILSAVVGGVAYLGFGDSGFFTKTYYGDLNALVHTTAQRPFITTWETTEANEMITIPTNSGYSYDYTVDWGDGATESDLTASASHAYATPGVYTVQITGDFPSIYFNTFNPQEGDNSTKIQSIEQWGDLAWKTMSSAFMGCTKLTSNASDAPDLSRVTNISWMFRNASSFNGDLSSWDVSNVIDMSVMFYDASSFDGDLSTWEVSNVIDMSWMFRNASSFNGDLSNWDVSNVIDMSVMFYDASSFNGDLSTWEVSNVIDMSWMFHNASSFNGDLSSWDVSNVIDMSVMFYDASSFDGNLSTWEVSNVIDMSWMFSSASSFNGDLSNWDVSNVTTMEEMLIRSGLSVANYDKLLTEWSKQSLQKGVLFGISTRYCEAAAERQKIIDDFEWMITDKGPSSFCNTAQRPFITTWETTEANEMITIPTNSGYSYDYTVDWGDGATESDLTASASHAYATPGVYTVQITGDFPSIYFNTFNPQEGDNSTKIQSIEQWGDLAWKTMSSAFMGCTKLTSNASDAPDLSRVTNMSSMFRSASSFDSDLSNWDVINVIDMSRMFYFASSFDSDLSTWDVSNVKDMSWMFFSASSFDSDLSNWDVSNVTNMLRMFFYASSFNGDLSTWEVSNVTTMEEMLIRSGLSVENYDKLLREWSKQSLQKGVLFGISIRYCEAAAERQKIIDDFKWMITDEGPSSLCNTAQRPFITTWETTQASEMITIPTNDFYYYYYNVDWGDGNIESKLTGSVSHVYATPGVYMVQITGDFPSIYFNTFSPEEGDNSTKIKSIEQWGDIAWETMNSAFMGCTKLTSNASDAPDLSLVRDMSSMFLNAASFNADISFWEVGFIRNMNSLFALARLFNQDLSSWDVSNVTDMTQMFQATSFDQDISSWNFNSAERMRFFSSNLSNQNYDKLLNSLASQTLKSNVTLDVQSYFCQSTNERQKIIDDFNWVINDNGQNCPVVNVMLSSTNLYENESESTQIGESFFESIGDIIVEDEESDTHEFILTGEDAEFFFLSRQSLFPNISFDYEGKSTYEIMIEVTDIGNNSLKKPFTIEILDDTLDNNPGFIFTWETTSPNESMRLPIDDSLDYNYTVIWGDGYANRGVEEKKNHSYSAPGIYSVEVYGDFPHFNSRAWDKSDQLLAIEQWGDIQWSTMENAFISCEKLVVNATDIPDLSQVTSTQGMFWGCESLTEGNLKSWDMANVLDMTAMFIGASVFNENIGSWNVSNAKEMNFMFAFASIFNQDISSWDVSNVENMNGLFTADTVFNQDISGWDVSSVTSMRSIFYNAKSFDQDLGTWEVVNVESFGDHRPFGGVFDADLISYGTFITLGGAFEGSGLSVANYDATLIGWSQIDNLRTNVELIATDKNFCTSYQERESLINNFNWMITDAEIADLCEEADHQILSVRDNKDLIVYPNPASDFITVNSDKQIQVLVYDLTGNLLLERDKNTINVSLLARGVYILKAFEENGETYSFRFQKE